MSIELGGSRARSKLCVWQKWVDRLRGEIRHRRPGAHDQAYELDIEELGVIVLDGRL